MLPNATDLGTVKSRPRCDFHNLRECDCENGTCRVQRIYVRKPVPTPNNSTHYPAVALICTALWGWLVYLNGGF